MTIPSVKECPRCGESKPASAFYRERFAYVSKEGEHAGSTITGTRLSSWCRDCKRGAQAIRNHENAIALASVPAPERCCSVCDQRRKRLTTIEVGGRVFDSCRRCAGDVLARETLLGALAWLRSIAAHIEDRAEVERVYWSSDHAPTPLFFATHLDEFPFAACPSGLKHSACVAAEARARRVYEFFRDVAG